MTLKDLLKSVKSAESSISTLLGVVVVIAIGALIFNYFKTKPFNESLDSESGEISEEASQKNQNNLPSTYVVASGDTLWKISEKFYNSGYNWVDIKEANNIENPNLIVEGQEITVPAVEPRIPTVAAASTEVTVGESEAINNEEYIVKKGDSLWDISVRAYQDGYRWTEIAKVNNLENPDLIHPGNKLVLPR
ncbi:LysM peptidoglycan-binding domain-containing protein [Candidatus Microgenomates bacterium]|jgi:nucleoid-associated protein YgaU|nr:MAG: LysM peptidoglycan-binding domain-containing protein [Candidatus Microgenomates bacterium]